MKKYLIVFSLLFSIMTDKNNKEIHTIEGIITTNSSNTLYIDTEDGNGWYLEENHNFKNGDRVQITYSNNGTKENIYDAGLLINQFM